jgi:CRISPR-associated protein Cmr1
MTGGSYMDDKNISIQLKPLTAIWTGDALGKCDEIKSQALYGGLRFWFDLYCKAKGIPVKSYNDERLSPSFTKEVVSDCVNQNISFDKAYDKKLKEEKISLSLSSKIFGCTGLMGDLKIISIKYSKKKSSILEDFNFSAYGTNNTSWAEKTFLVKDPNSDKLPEITNAKKIEIKVSLSPRYHEDFLEFLKYFNEKVILIGGKKSWGLGFVRLKLGSEENSDDIECFDIPKIYRYEKIKIPNKSSNGKAIISGFNMKYYLRNKEKSKENNVSDIFGAISKSSKFYFSNAFCDDKNKSEIYTYLLGFYDEWDECKFKNKFDEYKKIISERRSNA